MFNNLITTQKALVFKMLMTFITVDEQAPAQVEQLRTWKDPGTPHLLRRLSPPDPLVRMRHHRGLSVP